MTASAIDPDGNLELATPVTSGDPTYMFGLADTTGETISRAQDWAPETPITEEALAEDRINWPTWLMLFSPPMVEQYGEQFLLDLPAERIDQYDDGAILVVGTDQPDGDTHPDEFFELYRPPIERFEEAFGVEHAYRL